MSQITVRVFTVDDYQSAFELWSRIDGLGFNESDTVEAISAFLQRNPGFSAVAIDSASKVVGTVLCGHNGRAGSIQHLAVDVAYRRQGLAKRLLDYAFARLAEACIPRCNIFVYNVNHQGNDFWLNNEWADPTTWRVLQKHVPTSGHKNG